MIEERITSRKNPLLQQVKKLLSSKKAREEAGLFAADGTKLLAEAVRYYPGLHTVILSDGVQAEVPEHVRLVRVPGDVMESISPMSSPQGALFLCRLPEKKQFCPKAGMLILDGIQDPAPPPLSPFSPPVQIRRVDSPALSGRGSRPSGRTSG